MPFELEDYQLLRGRRDHATGRLETLRQRVILTEQEEMEVLLLERRLIDLAPHLEAAAAAAERVRQDAVIADAATAWEPLVAKKRAAVVAFRKSVAQMFEAYAALKQVHYQQTEIMGRLPHAITETLNFPGPDGLAGHLAGLMQPTSAWKEILTRPPHVGLEEAMCADEKGCQAFPMNAIARIARQQRERRAS